VASPPADLAGPLRFALANALLRTGRFAKAEAAGAAALALGPGGEYRGQLRWVLTQAYLNQGRAEAALVEARRALDDGDLTPWDAARADARLRAHGIRRGVRGERKRPKAGWAALTDTEQTVAALLAEGLSNPDIGGRMFISRRTVQFHVSHILAKLGLSSRVELAALVARRSG
jgi:DNA-binding NarL/FixJ family response regulator